MNRLLAIALVASAFTSACAPRVSTIPPPPKAKAVDVKPIHESVQRVSDHVAGARQSSAKLDVQLDNAEASARAAAEAAQRAFVEGVSAGGEAAIALKEKVAKVSTDLAASRATGAQLAGQLSKASTELTTAQTEISEVKASAAVMESEADSLRSDLDEANVRLTSAAKISDELAVQKSKTGFWRWSTVVAVAVAILIAVAWRVLP